MLNKFIKILIRKIKTEKYKNREYFVINATRPLSSGDFSSDTAGGGVFKRERCKENE